MGKISVNLFLLVALVIMLFVLSGCSGTIQTPPSCSLYIVSNCVDCWGNVYVSGFPTGDYLIRWGAVTVENLPCGQVVSVCLIDEFGYVSRYYYATVTGPNTLIHGVAVSPG